MSVLSNYPVLPVGVKKILMVVIAGIIVLAIGTMLSAQEKERQPIAYVSETSQPAKRVKTLTNNVLSAKDGDIEFSMNPKKMRVNVNKLGSGKDVRMVGAGKQFVTVFVQIRNTGEKGVSPSLDDQVLITAKGTRVQPHKDLQQYITNGDWYRGISAKGHASGTLVYEIDDDDKAAKLELHSARKSVGASISLK